MAPTAPVVHLRREVTADRFGSRRASRRHRPGETSMPRSTLRLEHLEDRCTPALWGNPWPDATHLTVSFAPDSTLLAGQNSTLFSTLSWRPGWQTEVLRALQTWAVQAGVNFSVTGDGGQALGVAGRPQGDLRFG